MQIAKFSQCTTVIAKYNNKNANLIFVELFAVRNCVAPK